MNRKGLENLSVGVLIMMFIAVVVVVALITGGISSSIGAVTQTVTISNQTYAAPATAGASIDIPYQALKGTIIVTNATSGTIVPASNYTITNYVVSNGQLVTRLTSTAGNTVGWLGKNINISSSVVEPFGYDTSAGGRSMTDMILIFSALALAVFVLSYVLRNGIIDI